MRKYYSLCLSVLLATTMYGCSGSKDNADEHDHEDHVDLGAVTYEELELGETTLDLPEGDYSSTYYLYSIESEMGDNEEVTVCFSFGDLSLSEYSKETEETNKPSEHKACVPFEDNSDNIVINGDTGVENATVKVYSKDGVGPKYEITM